MNDYRIISKPRPDGIDRFYFQINGETRQSSYNRYDILSFAEGYTGKVLPVEEDR